MVGFNSQIGDRHDDFTKIWMAMKMGYISMDPAVLIAAHNGLTDRHGASEIAETPDIFLQYMGNCSDTISQAITVTGTCSNPTRLNDGLLVLYSQLWLNQYATFDFDRKIYKMTDYRQHGSTANVTGNGRFKLQTLLYGVWTDNTTGIPVRTTNDWGTWTALTTEIYAEGFRLVCTTEDGGATGSCIIELEVRGV